MESHYNFLITWKSSFCKSGLSHWVWSLSMPALRCTMTALSILSIMEVKLRYNFHDIIYDSMYIIKTYKIVGHFEIESLNSAHCMSQHGTEPLTHSPYAKVTLKAFRKLVYILSRWFHKSGLENVLISTQNSQLMIMSGDVRALSRWIFIYMYMYHWHWSPTDWTCVIGINPSTMLW